MGLSPFVLLLSPDIFIHTRDTWGGGGVWLAQTCPSGALMCLDLCQLLWNLSHSQSSMLLHAEHRQWDMPRPGQQRWLAAHTRKQMGLFSISKLFRSCNILEIGFLSASLHLIMAKLSVCSSALMLKMCFQEGSWTEQKCRSIQELMRPEMFLSFY